MTDFNKKKLVLRQYLIGAGYFNALIAMEFASKFHKGLRRDKLSPEFDHQISIALYALTLPNLIFREEIIATIMYHDLREDYNITEQEIRDQHKTANPDFVNRMCTAVENMTKEWRGNKKDEAKLFDAMGDDPIASIAKGCDRIHNVNSMVGVFKLAKQKDYIAEVHALFFPMLKKARRNFPHQVLAYENIKFVLTSQIQLIEAIHTASCQETRLA